MKKKYLEPVILALLVVIAAVTVASCRKQADKESNATEPEGVT